MGERSNGELLSQNATKSMIQVVIIAMWLKESEFNCFLTENITTFSERTLRHNN